MLLESIENYTPFEYFAFEKMAPGRNLCDVLIVKAACALRPGTKHAQREEGIALLSDAAPFVLADEHYGEADHTSLRASADVVLVKPHTDFHVSGSAHAPHPSATRWEASIEVAGPAGTRAHRLSVHGPRHWQWSFRKGWHLSEPLPIDALPLRYELAFGGRYACKGEWIVHADNPVGVGHFDPDVADREQRHPAPQIEAQAHPVKRPGVPVAVPGLGPIARFWDAHSRYAGTYDAQWRRAFDSPAGPDYPADFDSRFFQAAHPDWIFAPWLEGGERVQLNGLHGPVPCAGRLPPIRLEALLLGAGGAAPSVVPMRLDTVHIDLDASRLYLTWRLTIPQHIGARTAVVRLFKRH